MDLELVELRHGAGPAAGSAEVQLAAELQELRQEAEVRSVQPFGLVHPATPAPRRACAAPRPFRMPRRDDSPSPSPSLARS